MRIAVITNNASTSIKVGEKLRKSLKDAGFELAPTNPTVVITVGGDGTLLNAFHTYQDILNHVRFIGVHTGHLGFYTDWRDYEIDSLVDSLKEDSGQSVSYPLLDVELSYVDTDKTETFLALNEATIKNIDRTMVAEVFIKNECFEKFRGDGLSVSTPTGSTAYSKSLGGAVLHPRINALQLNEVASINNRVYRSLGSPLIIAQDEWIRIDVQQGDQYQLNVDHFVIPQDRLKSLTYKISDKRIHFASYRHTHFWRRVNDAFIGDLESKE
ncbi:MAG: NAD kinase [Vagococcus sp.]